MGNQTKKKNLFYTMRHEVPSLDDDSNYDPL